MLILLGAQKLFKSNTVWFMLVEFNHVSVCLVRGAV